MAQVGEMELKILAMFGGQPKTLADLMEMGAWQVVNGDRNAVLYRINQLIKAGLLKKQAAKVKRKGHGAGFSAQVSVNAYRPVVK